MTSTSVCQGQGGERRWKLTYFAEDALHSIFLWLFDLTGIWVAIQALAYGACEGHKGVSAFSPALSRVSGRNTMISTSEFIWGYNGEAHQLPVLATCTVMWALVSPPMHYLMYPLSQLFTVWPGVVKYNVYDGFRHTTATVTPVRPHSVSRTDSELVTIEKCSFRANKTARNVTCDVPQTLPSYTVSYSKIQTFSKLLIFQTDFNCTYWIKWGLSQRLVSLLKKRLGSAISFGQWKKFSNSFFNSTFNTPSSCAMWLSL